MTFDKLVALAIDLPETLTNGFVSRNRGMAKYSDNLFSSASDALWQAAKRYDARRGKSFRAYATVIMMTRLAWTMRDIVRRAKLHEVQAPPEAKHDVADSRACAQRLPDDYYRTLTRRQTQVMCLRFEGGYSFRQIARKIGCSKANAYKLYRRGLRRIERTSDIGGNHDRE